MKGHSTKRESDTSSVPLQSTSEEAGGGGGII